jgi:diadenosine tetraphosphate (Ap4A) HIT family hydrolase
MAGAPCLFCDKLAALRELPGDEVVWQFAHSVALLGPWQSYHGYCVLVARRHATELSQLPPQERRAFLDELCLLAAAVEACFRPHKLNYELLGNQAPHLHWHVFPRYASDPELLKPVWLALDRAERDPLLHELLQAGPTGREETAAALRAQIQKMLPGPS